MATEKACEALKRTKEAIVGIKRKLQPVMERLNEPAGDGGVSAGVRAQAQATVALSMGMMRFMGARLRGLDQGRKPDDPLRQELDKMRKLLTEIKKKNAERAKQSDGAASKASVARNDGPRRKKRRVSSSSPSPSSSSSSAATENSRNAETASASKRVS